MNWEDLIGRPWNPVYTGAPRIEGVCQGVIRKSKDRYFTITCQHPKCGFTCEGYDTKKLCEEWNAHIKFRVLTSEQHLKKIYEAWETYKRNPLQGAKDLEEAVEAAHKSLRE